MSALTGDSACGGEISIIDGERPVKIWHEEVGSSETLLSIGEIQIFFRELEGYVREKKKRGPRKLW